VDVAEEVGRDNVILGVRQDACTGTTGEINRLAYNEQGKKKSRTLEFALSSSLDRRLDLVVGCTLLDTGGQVNDRDVLIPDQTSVKPRLADTNELTVVGTRKDMPVS
jgi:hypothetical protein